MQDLHLFRQLCDQAGSLKRQANAEDGPVQQKEFLMQTLEKQWPKLQPQTQQRMVQGLEEKFGPLASKISCDDRHESGLLDNKKTQDIPRVIANVTGNCSLEVQHEVLKHTRVMLQSDLKRLRCAQRRYQEAQST